MGISCSWTLRREKGEKKAIRLLAWQIVEAETSHHPSSLYQSRTDGGKEGREEEGKAGPGMAAEGRWV